MPPRSLPSFQKNVKVVAYAMSPYVRFAEQGKVKCDAKGARFGCRNDKCRHEGGSCHVDKALRGAGPYFSRCLRQRIPASRKPSISPLNTESGLPTSCSVRRSLTIW
ncbi:hypothetical protein SUDANB70_03839 [Streptomyces sp. enrichment culture]